MIDWPTSSFQRGRCDSPSTIWVTPNSRAAPTISPATSPLRRSTVAPSRPPRCSAPSTRWCASDDSRSSSGSTWST